MPEKEVQRDLDKVERYLAKKRDGKHPIKPIFAMTRIQSELERKFPRWVMRFALLTTSQSIPSALKNSIPHAPNVMKPELLRLIDNIDADPMSVQPYVQFFGFLNMPELRSMMMMIYSLSEYSTKDIDRHVLSVVKRNYALQATSEKIAAEETMGRFAIYVTIPMILTCLVLIVYVFLLVSNMMGEVFGMLNFGV